MTVTFQLILLLTGVLIPLTVHSCGITNSHRKSALTLTKSNCDPKIVYVNVCAGDCPSWCIPTYKNNEMTTILGCWACKPKEMEKLITTMTCSSGSKSVKYEQAKRCDCERQSSCAVGSRKRRSQNETEALDVKEVVPVVGQ